MAHITKAKKESVAAVEKLVSENPIVGIINLEGLPAAQLQRMRKKLGSKVRLFLTKKRLMKIALENVEKEKPGITKLAEKMRGIPALLFTDENPFKLYSILQKNKSKAAAKPGQISPNDIKVSAGMTNFAPGPIISELGSFGLKTKVTDGKIEIIKDHIVAKEGDEISAGLASLLVKMGIEPMEVGLDLVCVFEDGQIYGKDILAIDEEEYANNFTTAHRWAFNLAIDAGIFTDATTEVLVQKAFRNSKAVALEANILTDATTDEILAKADRQAKALKAEVKE